MSEILTTNELAELLKVSRNTINSWRKKGMPFLKGDTAIRFDKEAVTKWLNEKK